MANKNATVFRKLSGEDIKTKRHLLGYTQDEIATFCGLSRQTIANIESGRVAKTSSVYLITACLERLYDRCKNKSIRKAIDVLGI